jgi:hypothetical protein
MRDQNHAFRGCRQSIPRAQAVLEHVRIAECSPLFDELRRIISLRGVASCEVDMKGHLAGVLTNLRFLTKVWESPIMADSCSLPRPESGETDFSGSTFT